MALEIEPANPSDASQFTEVFLAAFSDDFNRTMFPATPDVREWLTKDFSESIARSLAESSHEVYLKVTDPSHGKLVAFAKWKRPVPAADLDRHDDSRTAGGDVAWPESSDTALCGRFFSEMDAQHQRWMGGRPHFCMFRCFLYIAPLAFSFLLFAFLSFFLFFFPFLLILPH